MVRMTVAHLGLDRSANTPVVVLREPAGDRTLRIWIGAAEAAAIALEMRGDSPPRPMTHDLLKHVLVGLGGELRRVTITGVRDNTYFAELLVYRGEQILEIDSRPSDGIALALRTDAPIFVREELLDGDAPEPGVVPPTESSAEQLKKFLAKLDPQDLGRFQP